MLTMFARVSARVLARVLASALAAALVVSFVGTADAATKKKKKRVYNSDQSQQSGERSRTGRVYSETDYPETLPFGSTVWWRSMDFYGRGGFGRGP